MRTLVFLLSLLFTAQVNYANNNVSEVSENRKKNMNKPFVFNEKGIVFAVYNNGSFDYFIPNKRGAKFVARTHSSNTHRVQRGRVINNFYNVPIRYDYFNRVTRIGKVHIKYNRFGNILSIGELRLHYKRGFYTHRSGFINKKRVLPTYYNYFKAKPHHKKKQVKKAYVKNKKQVKKKSKLKDKKNKGERTYKKRSRNSSRTH